MSSLRAKWRMAAVTATTALAVLMFSNAPASAAVFGESSTWASEIEDNVPVRANGFMGEARAVNGDLIQVWRGYDNPGMYLSLDHGRPVRLAGATNASPQVVYMGGAQFVLFHTGTNGFIFYCVLTVNQANNGQRYLNFGNWIQVPNGAQTNDGRPVAIAALPHNNISLAFHGANSNEIWSMIFNIPNNLWGDPVRVAGATSNSSPALAFSPANNLLLMAYRGLDNRVNVIRTYYQNNGWYGRSILDGVQTDSEPAIAMAGSGWGQVAVRQQGTGVLYLEDVQDTGSHGDWTREAVAFASAYGPRLIMDAYRAYLVATNLNGYVMWKQSRQY
ncbi:hypothetical protein ACFXPX_43200 [Kitasatospora sp. NPDC059146]|uniref:hypothetical protein n=1 Tax=unclassified Kitasatospora TaxID=2633591 RepID=UPI00368643F6